MKHIVDESPVKKKRESEKLIKKDEGNDDKTPNKKLDRRNSK